MNKLKSLAIIIFVLSYNMATSQCFPDRHNTSLNAGWISCDSKPNPNAIRPSNLKWIMYEFPEAYRVESIDLWNINHPDFLDYGVRELYVDISLDGQSWENVGTLNVSKAEASSFYEGESLSGFEIFKAKFVLLTVKANYGGECAGFAEVRFDLFNIATDDTIAPDLVLIESKDLFIGEEVSEITIDSVDEFVLSATDDCECELTIDWSPKSFSCSDLGPQELTITATDVAGNSTTKSTQINVIDTGAPLLTIIPMDQLAECGTFSITPLSPGVDITATDNCDGDISENIVLDRSVSIPIDCGEDGTVQTIIEYYSVTDASGNVTQAQYTRTFTDTESPQWEDTGLQMTILAECGEDIEAIVAANIPSAIDACAYNEVVDVFLSSETSAAGCGNSYERSLFYSVQDGCGNLNPDQYKVTIVVQDNTPPVWDIVDNEQILDLSCENDIDHVLSSNVPTATDVCGSVAVNLVNISNARFCGEYFQTIYAYLAVDDCGNVSDTFNVKLNVPVSKGPVFSGLPEDVTISCDDAYPDTGALLNTISAYDVCDGDLSDRVTLLGPPVIAECQADLHQFEDVYTISVENNCGITSTAHWTITTLNTLEVDLGPDAYICDETPVQLDAGNDGASYEWSNGATSQIISVDIPGTYTVTVTGQNGCCNVDQINVFSSSTPDLTVSADILDCNKSSVQLLLAGTEGTGSYAWTGPNGYMSSEKNPYVSTPGDYMVVYSANDGCASEASITVEQNITPPHAFAQGGILNCGAESVMLVASSDVEGSTFSWTGPNGFISTDALPIVTEPGTYNVLISAPNGCVSTADVHVGLSNELEPVSDFYYTVNELTVSFVDLSSGNPESWNWDFGDGNVSADKSPTHIYESAGEYTVRLEVNNVCGNSSTEEMIALSTPGIKDASWLSTAKAFPNPNNGQFNLEVKGDPLDKVNFKLVNNLGQLMHSEDLDYGRGLIDKQYNFRQLSSGTYFIRLEAEGQFFYEKLIVESQTNESNGN